MLTPNLSIYQHRSTNTVILPARHGDTQPGTPGGKAVKPPLGNTSPDLCPKALEPAQTLDFSKYALMRKAGEITGRMAVSECSTRPAYGNAGRPGYNPENKASGCWRGLATCRNVNICPTCAFIRARENTEELTVTLDEAKKQGFFPLLVTSTLRHDRTESLQNLVDALTSSWPAMFRRRAWRKLSEEIGHIGTITAIETTWGQANGWHPHIHALMLLPDNGPAENARIAALVTEYLVRQWRRESELLGRPLPSKDHGITVVHGDSAGAYIAKMGLSSELASAVTKSGREGRYTPWQLLRAAMPDTPEALNYARRFAEYGRVFRRRNILRWTPGLRDKFNVDEKMEILESQNKAEEKTIDIMVCTAQEMRAVCARRAHQRIINVINGVLVATNGHHDSIVRAVRHELDLIVYEYISEFRRKAGLRPLAAKPNEHLHVPGY